MGFKTTSDTAVYKQLDSIFSNIDKFQWKEFVMGFSFLVTLLVLRTVAQKYR